MYPDEYSSLIPHIMFDRSREALLIFLRRDYHHKKIKKKFIVLERLKARNRVQSRKRRKTTKIQITMFGMGWLSAPALKVAKNSQRRNTVKTANDKREARANAFGMKNTVIIIG